MSQVILHDTNTRELFADLLLDGVLQSFPQLALSLCYIFFVVETGLAWTAMLSIVITSAIAISQVTQGCLKWRQKGERPKRANTEIPLLEEQH